MVCSWTFEGYWVLETAGIEIFAWMLCSIAICDQRAFIIFIPICWNDLFVSLYEDEFHQIYSHKLDAKTFNSSNKCKIFI